MIGAALLGALAYAAPAQALTVVAGSGTLSSTDPTQTGRVSRDTVASTWAAPKAFPGSIGGTYVYDLVNGTISFNATQTIFYEITYNSINTVVSQPFAVAYRNSFNPASISTNYIGDSGSSAGGVNANIPQTFQVIVAAGGSLLVNFSEVSNGNLPTDYTYTISAFSDANRGENFGGAGAVPEPASWAMMIAGFGLVGGAMRRRSSAKLAIA
jgi:hypothetical protein